MTFSLILLGIAISIYPGGTYQDKNSVGFDWSNNYISNLFEANALNGAQNTSRIWAYLGMFVYSISCAIFLLTCLKKYPKRTLEILLNTRVYLSCLLRS